LPLGCIFKAKNPNVVLNMFKLEIRYAYTVSLQQLDAQSVREQLLCTISERTAWLS